MGHRVGWLALGAGLAGGADAILIPEIPYTIDKLADSILDRVSRGKRFSIVAVAEGAITVEGARKIQAVEKKMEEAEGEKRSELKKQLKALDKQYRGSTIQMADELQKITGLETRVTILGHLQRGGTPSAADRLLATRLGTAAVDYIQDQQFGIMVAVDGEQTKGVPLGNVAGKVNYVPPSHPWVTSARNLATSFGD
jgi:6-phosphofructokinase 1